MEDKEIMEKLPDMVDKGLERLTNYQHYDGGWGWWENDESHPFMTAYVVFGLGMAKQAGFEIPQKLTSQGSDWILNNVLDDELDAVTRAYMLYAVAVAQGEDADKDFIIKQINAISAERRLGSYALALISLTLDELGEKQMATEYAKKLEDAKIYRETVCYWGGEGQEALLHWQDDRLEITATAIRAISKFNPDSDYLFPAVRWLIMNRQGNRWKSTKDTATILFSLVDYLKSRGELNPDYDLTVYVNDEKVKDIKVKGKESFKELGKDIILDSSKLKVGENNVIKIEKNGKGALYYSSYTNYYNESERITATSHGIKIDRKYYKLVPVKNRWGNWVYDKRQLSYGQAVKSGDEILVELTIDADQYSEYVMLEDPLPSGCEIIEDDKRYKLLGEETDDDYWYDWEWAYWYSQREFRDEKATFFMSKLQSETQTITYVLRAEKPGYYRIMPAKIELMYMPEIGGNTQGFELEIKE